MQNFCSNCGQKLTYDSRYCPHCGNLLKKENVNNDLSDIKFFSKDMSMKDQGDLTNQKINNVAPNIITEKTSYQTSEDGVKTNAFAIIGFVLSLCSLLTCGLSSILGLIFSVIGIITSKKYKNNGKGFAIAGTIISSVFVIILVLFCIILILSADTSSSINTNGYNGPMY